jgi:hypothetical protein
MKMPNEQGKFFFKNRLPGKRSEIPDLDEPPVSDTDPSITTPKTQQSPEIKPTSEKKAVDEMPEK